MALKTHLRIRTARPATSLGRGAVFIAPKIHLILSSSKGAPPEIPPALEYLAARSRRSRPALAFAAPLAYR